MKRFLSILLTVALVFTLVPIPFGAAKIAEAAGAAQFFIFPNEQYTPASARVTNNERITLNGTLNGVNGNTMSYSIYQITMNGTQESIIDKREEQTAGINLNGSQISIPNLQLFPGLNRITFKGMQGASQVTDSIFIEYRNGPTMYDMMATLDGYNFDLKEKETTVVHSPQSKGRQNVNISISGKAPNADKVQVTVNGRSWTFNVAKANDYTFFASPISVNKGKNVVTIKSFNGNQAVETTRELAFYNDTVTFVDVHMLDNAGNKVDLATNSTAVVGTDKKIYGRALIPIVPNTANPPIPTITYEFDGVTGTAGNVQLVKVNPTFMELSFDIDQSSRMVNDKELHLKLISTNMSTVPPSQESQGGFSITLKDASKPYIHEIKYLPGYNANMNASEVLSLQGSNMEGAEIFSLPAGVEILIPNGSNQAVTIDKVTDAFNKSYTAGFKLSDNPVATDTVVHNINGVPTSMLRLIYVLEKLPITGQQTLEFKTSNGEIKKVTVTMLYGPFVKFDTIHDGMKIYTDTTEAVDQRKRKIITEALGQFKGQLFNIATPEEIEYNGTKKSVFFYINNTTIELIMDGSDKSKFILKDDAERDKAFAALYAGDNKLKFVFRSKNAFYEKSVTVTLIPTNLPVIPAPNTAGVFPFNVKASNVNPKHVEADFEKQGSVYLTRLDRLKVYGTFDFIDLGKSASAVEQKINDLRSSNQSNNYKVVIKSPSLKQDIVWSLDHNFKVEDINGSKDIIPNNNVTPNPNLIVTYHAENENFSFVITSDGRSGGSSTSKDDGILVPVDGSPLVINMTVYNNGEGGPRASYRLEVVPINLPYSIVKPSVEQRVVNQNFVEVIISSPGADKVTINKINAEKIAYDPDYDKNIDYPHAYRAFVTGLKPNRENKIEFIITKGKDSYKQSFTVKYVATAIPGAQFMEKMKNSHKVFDNTLTLTLAKGTNLIRKDHNVPEQFKTQVYNEHNMLFALANPHDGVVDRKDFETIPANFNLELIQAGTIFRASFPERFIKASSVFWIDPGMADDIHNNTPGSGTIQGDNLYDPIPQGSQPHQLPGSPIPMFYNRGYDRELVPSKAGKLTLSYDKNLAQDAGRLVSVFRFDPDLQQWENIGGVVDNKKRTITVPFERFGYYVVGKMGYSYPDVVQHPYARDHIETIFAKGVMNAEQPLSSFGTDLYVSRPEFARMLVRAKELPLNYDGPQHFNDVYVPPVGERNKINTTALYDFRYIETAAREGIVRGVEPQVFGVNLSIQRQDAAVMIAKALNMKLETNPDKVKKDLLKYFEDADKVDYYARPSVLAIAKKGFIKGIPVEPKNPKTKYVFNPNANMLRGDAALIMANVMIDMKKLPKM
ncbi:S-layer homology domain-containing protein [Paenibacillus sp. 481]|uniref:S-layer homology domain-containing protein n=1 Tax=Paenibacillus sp. 481 TaxID=2835869 RepID=UPI001E5F6EEE|nr:S-layer homology domain-containing protein [Paenibacillus sp. 481]UHA75692.1 S-layer homology domain-containing protein [Paenibacillus sp. 481]